MLVLQGDIQKALKKWTPLIGKEIKTGRVKAPGKSWTLYRVVNIDLGLDDSPRFYIEDQAGAIFRVDLEDLDWRFLDEQLKQA